MNAMTCEICNNPNSECLITHSICSECYSQVELNKLRTETEQLKQALKSIAGTGGESHFHAQRDHMKRIAINALKYTEET